MQYKNLARIYDELMYDAPYDAWQKFIEKHIKPASFVAEIACGTGEMTVRLAEKYSVIASDISPEMLDVASEKSRKAGLPVQFICEDMCNLELNKKADACVCVCDGFNYLLDSTSLEKSFSAVRQNVKDGGVFIFDVSSKSKLEKMDGQVFFDDGDDVTYLWQNSFENGLLKMELTFFVKSEDKYLRFDETHIQRAWSKNEIADMLKKCSFSLEGTFDGYTDNEDNSECERITFLAKAI